MDDTGAAIQTRHPPYRLLLPLLAVFASACGMLPGQPPETADGDILYVYDDGRMRLNDRYVDPGDVVIYRDGYGGERAALKMRVPLHPDYYRDTIIVERLSGPGEAAVD